MIEIEDEGLFLVEDGEVIHVHTSSWRETDFESLREYFDKYGLFGVLKND